MTAPIAFFDLDLTILAVNSATLWIKQEFKEGRLSLWNLSRALYWLTIYHLGGSSMIPALLSGLKTLKGQSVDEFSLHIQKLYHHKILQEIRLEAREMIKWHQGQGHLCCLMTNASSQLAVLIQNELQLEGVICNHLESIDGLLTGFPAQDLCFGEGKLRYAKAILTESELSLGECYFYTDSYSDLPLLEAVGEPRVVSPDRKLRLEANRRSWRILDW